MTTGAGALLGLVLVFGTLLMTSSVLTTEYRPSEGIPVLLSHRCTHQEEMGRGDRRDVVVRYKQDHSSFVNAEQLPVENDLRRKIEEIMATRQEQVLFFAADERLAYREVSEVLSDLRRDDPALVIVLLTESQVGSVEQIQTQFHDMCLSAPQSDTVSAPNSPIY
jgi:biopolymer transport protein ExbD